MTAWALLLAVPPGGFSDRSDSLKLSSVIGKMETNSLTGLWRCSDMIVESPF